MLALLLLGCEDAATLPPSWTLEASGVSVEITRAPFAIVVRDAGGTEVLSSVAGGAGDGYGPVAWTSGGASYRSGTLFRT